MGKEEGGVVVSRAEIDTSAPFQSVKEAVMLFGEKVLAGEIYANKLHEMRVAASRNEHGSRNEHSISLLGSVSAELEETRQSLEKEREESLEMETCLNNLKAELEKTNKELKLLKAREPEKLQLMEPVAEDIKFVESATRFQVEKPMIEERVLELQKKRSVRFAEPPTQLAQVLYSEEQVLEKQLYVDKEDEPMKKKKKKKMKNAFIRLRGIIFSRT